MVLSHWKRSLNGLDQWSLRCCLSARGFSSTAGSGEGNVPALGCSATTVLVWTEGEITDGSRQQPCCETSHHSQQNVFTASPPKPVLTAGGEVKSWGTDWNWYKIKPDKKMHWFQYQWRWWNQFILPHRVATSKSSGTCWTLACLQDSLENSYQTGILQGALGTFFWTSLYMRTVKTNSIWFNAHKGMMQSVQFFSDPQESVLKAIAIKMPLLSSVSKPSSRQLTSH